jgi:ketosteroid isomerase-like protein
MAHPNAELIARAYDAFGQGDIPTVLGVFAPDITWHIPGRSPISGDYKGHDEVVGFFAKFMELSDGTFRLDVDEIVCDGERVYAHCTVSAERHGQAWSSPEIHVWRVVDGRAVEFREFQGDQQTEDEFWASS